MPSTNRRVERESRALRHLRRVLRQARPDTDLYRLFLGCLPVLLDLEAHGVRLRAAHLDPDGITMCIDAPPEGVIEDWCYVSPPRGMPRAPVTCRAIVGQSQGAPIAVEWQAPMRFSGRGRA